ncbi:MAG: tRNA pseudouridine(38-40) synthase TruA [Caldilineaceae bacterium]
MTDATLYVAGRVAYDGTDYHGFQVQRHEPTIQAALETALLHCTGHHVRVIGSGRTDTGVHASGQVIAASVPWKHTIESLQKAWNAHLPKAIAVRDLVLVSAEFHPRFSAKCRTYCYTIYDCDGTAKGKNGVALTKVSPLTDRFALYVPHVLDVVAMQRAAAVFCGQHDFATFGQPPQGENTVRVIHEATWQLVESNLVPLSSYPGRRLVFTVTATAFLRQMVRNVVGTLLNVGKGLWSPLYVEELLDARDRGRCSPPAPPQGLVLEKVTYPEAVNPWP